MKILEAEPNKHYIELRKQNSDICIYYPWLNKNKFESFVSASNKQDENKISARKCKITEITQKEANIFLDKYHLQGSTIKQSLCYGLYYKDELICVGTFGKPRFNNHYDYEFIRFCVKNNYHIIGAISKIIKRFLTDTNNATIISYSDFSRSNINESVFKKIGFTSEKIIWYKNNKVIYDTSLLKQGADRLLGTNYGSVEKCGMNNHQIMEKEGFVKYYDCGNIVYSLITKHNPYIYKITNLLNGKTYIGSHFATINGNCHGRFDGPICNYESSSKNIKKDIDKFGIDNFKKEIIKEFDLYSISRGELQKIEFEYINEEKSKGKCEYNHNAKIYKEQTGEAKRFYKILYDKDGKHIVDINNNETNFEEYVLKYCNKCKKETKHCGNLCFACHIKKNISKKYCNICKKETKHYSNLCMSCFRKTQINKKYCNKCGKITTHRGNTCESCINKKSDAEKEEISKKIRKNTEYKYCDICKKVTGHIYGKCIACKCKKNISEKYCNICKKVTKHRGETCYVCSNNKRRKI